MSGRAPLSGIRVIDLTVVWSGPGATTLLGDLGAEVIRVEDPHRLSRQVSASTTRATVAGGYASQMYPEGDPGDRPYDRSSVFNWHARNKLSASMTLTDNVGRDAFWRLVKVSDVLVENNSNGVLEKLGISHEHLLEVNPALIVARMPPLGLTGPMSSYLGYGPNFNAIIGIQAMDGYSDRDITSAGDNYHMDEASPASLAFAVLAALWRREETGKGSLIEFPQAENAMQDIGEYFLDYQLNGRLPAPLGNSDPYVFQDVFPTKEPDSWVAITIRDDPDWQRLCGVLGEPPWCKLGATTADRIANTTRLKEEISGWSAIQTSSEIVRRVQAAGVPCGGVMSETRLLSDPHLQERQWFQLRSHANVGTYAYPGHPWKVEGFDLVWGRPLPAFGEDNEYVYVEVLGYSKEEFQQMLDTGVIRNEQVA